MKLNLQYFADEEIVSTGANEVSETANQEESVNPVAESETPVVEEDRDKDRDAIFASMRRKAEAEAKAKYDAEIEKLNSKVVRNFSGYINPDTGKPIASANEYFDIYEKQENDRRMAELEKGGISRDEFQAMIDNNPAVLEANRYLAMRKQEEAMKALDADFAKIVEIDDSYKGKTVDDLPESIKARVINSNGAISLLDSFKIENYGVISSKKAEALQQKAINDMRGKSHLNPVNGVAENDSGLDIPESELPTWQKWNPGLSYAELKKKYNRVLNS